MTPGLRDFLVATGLVVAFILIMWAAGALSTALTGVPG